MRLVVYGSFNCPFSFLASRRVDRLVEFGSGDVEWRAVVHATGVPRGGVPVAGELAEMLDRELEEIRGLLLRGESYPARRPTVQPDTTLAVGGYAEAPLGDADRVRTSLFEAYWTDALDIGDPDVLRGLVCPVVPSSATMQRWRRDWTALERPMVPMLVQPDGTVSRGVDALKTLAGLELDALAHR